MKTAWMPITLAVLGTFVLLTFVEMILKLIFDFPDPVPGDDSI